MQPVHVGYGNYINGSRIVAVIAVDSMPVRRMLQEAKDGGRAIDATCGHKTRAAVVMESGHVVLSALMPETLIARVSSSLDTDETKKERAE